MARPLLARQVRPNLVQGFSIGCAIWFVPVTIDWAMGVSNSRVALYALAWILAFHFLALWVIGAVYATASRRGVSLVKASVVSIGAALPVIVLSFLLDYAIADLDPSLMDPRSVRPTNLPHAVVQALGNSLAMCTLLAAVVFLPAFARANQLRTDEVELLEREAELLRIRAHLEPHFVLNSLNAVAGLIEEDATQARELLAALGDLFREASTFRAMHSVRDEIEWLKRYVIIHELRHPEALQATWELSDEALALECPALILQPLVENAVKHGALRGGGRLKVRAKVDAGVLLLSVEDDGPALGAPRPGGRGLEIVRRRLELEYGQPGSFELVRENALTVARVRMPARAGPATGAPRV